MINAFIVGKIVWTVTIQWIAKHAKIVFGFLVEVVYLATLIVKNAKIALSAKSANLEVQMLMELANLVKWIIAPIASLIAVSVNNVQLEVLIMMDDVHHA